jgi:hypothetical protein
LFFLRALETNSTLINYWHNSALFDQGNNLTFSESESIVNTEALAKQYYQQHGYKILDKIDQLIMIMVTRMTANNNHESVLKEYFHRIAETHSEYKMKQDHVDVSLEEIIYFNSLFFSRLKMLCAAIIECLKNVMYQNGNDWTIKHEMTWMKLLNLITNPFLSPQPISSSTTKILS